MANNPVGEALVAESDKAVSEIREQFHERTKGKPTPTQHECDLIKAGAPPETKEPDGAGPDIRYGFVGRQGEASSSSGSGGGYVPRQPRPAPTRSTPAE